MTSKLLRRPDVEKVTGLSRSGIYAKMNKGDFPRPMRLGPRAVAWREIDIQEWIASLAPSVPEGGDGAAATG